MITGHEKTVLVHTPLTPSVLFSEYQFKGAHILRRSFQLRKTLQQLFLTSTGHHRLSVRCENCLITVFKVYCIKGNVVGRGEIFQRYRWNEKWTIKTVIMGSVCNGQNPFWIQCITCGLTLVQRDCWRYLACTHLFLNTYVQVCMFCLCPKYPNLAFT